jgi:hypothetical protein
MASYGELSPSFAVQGLVTTAPNCKRWYWVLLSRFPVLHVANGYAQRQLGTYRACRVVDERTGTVISLGRA